MLTDRHGKEIGIGSIVNWRLVITNEIAGADPVNLLARPEQPWPGIPDNQRFALAAAFIDVVQPTPGAKPESPVVPSTAAAAPAPTPAQPAAVAPPPQPPPPPGWPQHYPGYR